MLLYLNYACTFWVIFLEQEINLVGLEKLVNDRSIDKTNETDCTWSLFVKSICNIVHLKTLILTHQVVNSIPSVYIQKLK